MCCQLLVNNNELEGLPLLPSGLETLSVSHNNLAALGPELTSCVRLRVLVLSYNNIVALPRDVATLGSLEELNADHNHIDSLASVGDFSGMAQLQVRARGGHGPSPSLLDAYTPQTLDEHHDVVEVAWPAILDSWLSRC